MESPLHAIDTEHACRTAALDAVLAQVKGAAVHVVGDLVLDRWLSGSTARISREAPVPIVVQDGLQVQPGAAANAAMNLASLGATATAFGVVGDCADGAALSRALADGGVALGAPVASGHATATKTRVMAGSPGTMLQQVLRIDVDAPATQSAASAVLVAAERAGNAAPGNGLLLSDYGAGVVTPAVLAWASAQGAAGRVVLLDSRYALHQSACAHMVVKPNNQELAEATGMPTRTLEQVIAAARALRERTGARAVLATRGNQGMVWIGAEGVHSIGVLPTASDATDVTGAGDSVAAAVCAALTAGATVPQAMALATAAATWVVSQSGTVAPTSTDVLSVASSAARAQEMP